MGDNPPKFITLSSIGMSGSRPQADKAWGCCGCMAKLMIEHMLADVFNDMQAAEDLILKATDSKLVVTIARATVLGDKANYFKDYSARKPGYKLQAEDDLGGTTMTIDRQHVAEAILDLAETSEWDNKQPSIFSVSMLPPTANSSLFTGVYDPACLLPWPPGFDVLCTRGTPSSYRSCGLGWRDSARARLAQAGSARRAKCAPSTGASGVHEPRLLARRYINWFDRREKR